MFKTLSAFALAGLAAANEPHMIQATRNSDCPDPSIPETTVQVC